MIILPGVNAKQTIAPSTHKPVSVLWIDFSDEKEAERRRQCKSAIQLQEIKRHSYITKAMLQHVRQVANMASPRMAAFLVRTASGTLETSTRLG